MNIFEASPKLIFGENSLSYLNKLPNKKIFIVTDEFIVSSGIINKVTDYFDNKGYNYKIFSKVAPDPSIETVCSGLAEMLKFEPKIIIGFGGGSPIDVAKALLFFYVRYDCEDDNLRKKPEFIAIPTTSGTGSEVTSYSVITDKKNKVKIPLTDKMMIPDVAILEDEFTKTLPKAVIANTGMDVFTHGLEAFVSNNSNAFTDLYAKEACSKTYKNIYNLCNNPKSSKLRERMYIASTMAGLAFTNSSLGLNHGIAHTIGAEFGIPHGKANAVIMPYVVAFNCGFMEHQNINSMAKEKYSELSKFIGLSSGSVNENCKSLIVGLQILNAKLEIPTSLKAMGVNGEEFTNKLDDIADKILKDVCTKNNPIEVEKNFLKLLLLNIFEGKLVV